MRNQTISTVLITSLLSACNGGGGDNSPTPGSTATVLTGSFVDSPVAGLKYETPTQSGLTNENGEFSYIEGESVTFYLGATELGVALGKDQVTPFSLFGLSPLVTEFEITESLSGNTVNSFDRAINVATLLQTFDEDNDPENGINLGSSHADLMAHPISLYVKAKIFEDQDSLTASKLAVSNVNIQTYGDAIQHMYSSLNIDIESSLTSEFTSIQNNKQLELISFEYDENGNITKEKVDTNNNGETDKTKTFTYDQNNNISRITNSETNTTETREYDSNNNLLSRLTEPSQGIPTQESYRYSSNKLERFELDLGADGSIERTTFYSYNLAGDITSYQVDSNGDGEINSLVTYSYANGVLSKFIEDNNNDGYADIVINYTYENNGNQVAKNMQVNSLGQEVRTLSTFIYDLNNNPLRYEHYQYFNGNTTTDHIETYNYNENNLRTQYKRDSNGDGSWDFVAQYSYDVNGNKIKMIEDSDGNGIVDKIWTGNYQAAILDNTWEVILNKL